MDKRLKSHLAPLWVILVRPWTWFMLGGGIFYLLLFGLAMRRGELWRNEHLARVGIARGADAAGAAASRVVDVREGGALAPRSGGLAALERAGIGGAPLEADLAALAADAPRLETLAIELGDGGTVTDAMLASLERMPALRTILVSAGTRVADEPATLGLVDEVRRRLPGRRVLPGTFRPMRVIATVMVSACALLIPLVFWYQAGLLLATPTVWMLPRRLGAHLLWPCVVAVPCAVATVAVLVGLSVDPLKAAALALLVAGASAYGPVAGDLPGWPARVTGALARIETVAAMACSVTALAMMPYVDGWLVRRAAAADVVIAVAVVAATAWKIARLARLPRILAERGQPAPLGLAFDVAAAADQPGDRPGRWWQAGLPDLGDASVDRHLARPLPARLAGSAAFGERLRRAQPWWQVPLAVATVFVATSLLWIAVPALGRLRDPGPAPALRTLAPSMFATFASAASVAGLAFVVARWGQRRGGVALESLRPVSRSDFWLGLRWAIARDLVLPALLGAVGLATAALIGRGAGHAWLVAGMSIAGVVGLAHAMTLLLVVTRHPLVVGTIAILAIALAVGATVVAEACTLEERLQSSAPAGLAIGGAVLAVGVAARLGVLRGLAARELA